MSKGRLEAFSDAGIAIIITIMVLELEAPEACYASAIPLAFVSPWIADTLYVAVALIWLVPDRRIESRLAAGSARSA